MLSKYDPHEQYFIGATTEAEVSPPFPSLPCFASPSLLRV